VHPFPSLQESVLLVWTQPPGVVGLQESLEQGLPSSQLGAGPPTQTSFWHVSPVVHALPSSHGAVLLVCVQPEPGLQPSVVQTSLSLQLGGAPPTQLPPLQVSGVVQALPSLHGLLLFVKTQPEFGLQLSVVQTLLSLQTTGSLTQV
jgi:hypothetical protein